MISERDFPFLRVFLINGCQICFDSLQEKDICSLGSMLITKNTFLGLKIDVHNLCTLIRPEEHKLGPYVPRLGQIPEEHNDLCLSASPTLCFSVTSDP
jgi:hypothetical protein